MNVKDHLDAHGITVEEELIGEKSQLASMQLSQVMFRIDSSPEIIKQRAFPFINQRVINPTGWVGYIFGYI